MKILIWSVFIWENGYQAEGEGGHKRRRVNSGSYGLSWQLLFGAAHCPVATPSAHVLVDAGHLLVGATHILVGAGHHVILLKLLTIVRAGPILFLYITWPLQFPDGVLFPDTISINLTLTIDPLARFVHPRLNSPYKQRHPRNSMMSLLEYTTRIIMSVLKLIS